ncbi:SRPBCC family protein [Streptomyces sp. NPDC008313]|uniref:SRPBCC family protein n=1 Tax=Streptomyces sp. NPDC008313 TaxID=3364826 RepID=UPI0036E93164
MAHILLERATHHPVEQAWLRITDWERHADTVPLTSTTVLTPPPTRVGTVFVARSGVGRAGFDDPMEVTVWEPPRDGRPGRCRLVKRGRAVTGWAELTAHPAAGGGSRVVWSEELRVRWLPAFFDGPLAWAARRMFGRAADDLLSGPSHPS